MSSKNPLAAFDDLPSRLKLDRQNSVSPYVIVEGQDDLLVLTDIAPRFKFFAANGRQQAVDALEEALVLGVDEVRALVDRDFLGPTVTDLADPHVFYYDARDLEGMLIALGVLHRVIEVCAAPDKLNACGGARRVVETAVEEAAAVSRIRYLNALHDYGLNFDKIGANQAVDAEMGRVDVRAYVRRLCAEAQISPVPSVLDEVDGNFQGADWGPRGKDVIGLLSALYRDRIGKRGASLGQEMLLATLQLSGGIAVMNSNWFRRHFVESPDAQ